jgi:hypothetical protein
VTTEQRIWHGHIPAWRGDSFAEAREEKLFGDIVSMEPPERDRRDRSAAIDETLSEGRAHPQRRINPHDA